MARRIQQPPWRRSLGLLLAALLAVALAPVFAQEPTPATPLLPNTEPDEAALLAAPLSEEEVVLAALDSYAADPEAAAALADIPEESMLLATRLTYLPQLPGREVPVGGGQNPAPTPTPTPSPERSADVAVTVRARPSILVRPGDVITYTFTLRNTGDAQANETKVTMPFDPAQVTPISTVLSSRSGDWLSELRSDRYTVTFGPLGKGAERSGVVVRVNAGLPVRPADPVVIDARARYTWRDGGGGERRTNWAPVVVGAGSTHGDFVWVRVTPDRAPAGATHVFFSNRFLPGERVSAWVNVHRGAGGVRALNLVGTANALGEVELRLRSTDPNPDLPVGTHQIVLAGQRSGLQGVADFTVQ